MQITLTAQKNRKGSLTL